MDPREETPDGPGSVEPAELRESFEATPINAFLGLELVERLPRRAVVRLPLRPELLQEEGIVHGGVLTSLMDTAAVYALHPELGPEETMTSIEFKLNFLRPSLLDKGPLLARSTVVQRGRRVGLCEVEAEQAGRLVGKGLFTYMFLPRP